jgi:hypothetical protein
MIAVRALRHRVAFAAALAAMLPWLACRRAEPAASAPPPEELQTVDVAPPPDSRVDPSRDVQERRRAESFSGVMPEAFPKGLPLPPGASLVDQGGRWVEVLVGRRSDAVSPQYVEQLRAAGWQVTRGGTGTYALRRGGTSARVSLTAAGPSTRIRIDY